jgi:hypothetical protein
LKIRFFKKKEIAPCRRWLVVIITSAANKKNQQLSAKISLSGTCPTSQERKYISSSSSFDEILCRLCYRE